MVGMGIEPSDVQKLEIKAWYKKEGLSVGGNLN